MPAFVRQGGQWKEGEIWVRQGGLWKRGELSIREGGTWKIGAASLTYTPPPGTYNYSEQYAVTAALSASEPVVWSFTLPPNVTASISSGTSAAAVTFTLPAEPPVNLGDPFVTRTRTVNVTATANSQSSNFTLNLTALGD